LGGNGLSGSFRRQRRPDNDYGRGALGGSKKTAFAEIEEITVRLALASLFLFPFS
jgi:hypothetical protein